MSEMQIKYLLVYEWTIDYEASGIDPISVHSSKEHAEQHKKELEKEISDKFNKLNKINKKISKGFETKKYTYDSLNSLIEERRTIEESLPDWITYYHHDRPICFSIIEIPYWSE